MGQFAPNAWGLHDTAGNVWEWVSNCWREEESSARRGSAGGESRGDCGGPHRSGRIVGESARRTSGHRRGAVSGPAIGIGPTDFGLRRVSAGLTVLDSVGVGTALGVGTES